MSIVSSRVSSVSSILKAPGVRSQLIRQSNRVYFKLPRNLKNILYNYETGNGTKDYEDLVHVLRDANIKDSDLIEFLSEVRQHITLLGPVHKLFVETLLQLKWTIRSTEVTSAYKAFLEDLICMQIYHAKFVIDSLIEQFKPDVSENTVWEAGKFREEDVERLNHIHDVLQKTLKVVPMSSKLLLQSLRARFPYIVHGTHTHEVYIYALLQIIDYAPQLRSDILSLIINRLMVLDVNIPSLEPDNGDEELMDDNECDSILDTENSPQEDNDQEETNKLHPIAQKLDACMELLLKYLHDSCFVNEVLQIESLKRFYFDILKAFETVILTTHGSQYVQYIMFYICSFKAAVAEAFVDSLWRKVSNPNVPSVIRQSSVAYIASLLSVGKFITPGMVKAVQFKMSQWIHRYINMQHHSTYVDAESKEHAVFQSVCQALFFIITRRHNDHNDSKNHMLYLQELDLAKIISCKLNPLKSCRAEIAHDFAEVTRIYQLAYCYNIIENNTRSQLPAFNSKCSLTPSLGHSFPFDSYLLPRSGQRLYPLFRDTGAKRAYGSTVKHKEDIEYMTE